MCCTDKQSFRQMRHCKNQLAYSYLFMSPRQTNSQSSLCHISLYAIYQTSPITQTSEQTTGPNVSTLCSSPLHSTTSYDSTLLLGLLLAAVSFLSWKTPLATKSSIDWEIWLFKVRSTCDRDERAFMTKMKESGETRASKMKFFGSINEKTSCLWNE